MDAKSSQVRLAELSVEKRMREIGGSEAVRKFIGGYGPVKTKRGYLTNLRIYLDWLRKEKGITLSPDELVQDNLISIFKSDPTDVKAKRKHLDWLNEFLNVHAVERGLKQGTREVYAAVVKQFYRTNDSTLWGNFTLARSEVAEPEKPLKAEDIRKVLRVLPIQIRTPLLAEWQSGIEIDRILSLRWGQVDGVFRGDNPVRLTFYGRKRHRKEYSTYLGGETINHLKLWKERWIEVTGREPEPSDLVFLGQMGRPIDLRWINHEFKRTAVSLAAQALIENGHPESWHSHFLRHSFSTECSHAGVRSEIREYFMGHIAGVGWVYQHPELHEDDYVREYQKVEPYVSMEASEVTIRGEYETMERTLLKRVIDLERKLEGLSRGSS